MAFASKSTLFKLAIAAFVGLAYAGAQAADEKQPAPTMQKPAADQKAPASKAPASKESVPKESASADRMDINSASEAQLATLHGIGEARAKAIVAGRPYNGRDDLVKRKIIPQGVYDGIKDQIIARQK